MVSDEGSSNKNTYCQNDIDDLAYSYVLSHGYEGALVMMDTLLAHCGQDDVAPDDGFAVLCRRILDAIHDEAATIARTLDRMIAASLSGVPYPMAAVLFEGSNPIDRHIGERLRCRRVQLGLSRTTLAADLALTVEDLAAIEDGAQRLDAAGLHRASVSMSVPATYFFQNTHRADEVMDAWRRRKG
jgi:hypothetical protein